VLVVDAQLMDVLVDDVMKRKRNRLDREGTYMP
jgi:hypothetical protein